MGPFQDSQDIFQQTASPPQLPTSTTDQSNENLRRKGRRDISFVGSPKSGHGLGTGVYDTRWWFLNIFYFHLENWGRRTQFDKHIFQDGVGSTTNQDSKKGILPNFESEPWCLCVHLSRSCCLEICHMALMNTASPVVWAPRKLDHWDGQVSLDIPQVSPGCINMKPNVFFLLIWVYKLSID